jgi:6-phosphogluconolactonase
VSSDPLQQVSVFRDIDALSRAAADRFVSLFCAAIQSHGRFAAALSGGSTPRRLYFSLGSSPYRENIDWKRAHLFWADERCVAPIHEDSNYRLVADTMLFKAAVPEENIHRIHGEAGAGPAAAMYEEELHRFFAPAQRPVFDLVILGAGVDGHTASLFPGSTSLQERTRDVLPVYRKRPDVDRVSLTLPVLNRAAHVLFLVAGNEKADIVNELLISGNRKQYPAGRVQPTGGTLSWFIDKAAASKI